MTPRETRLLGWCADMGTAIFPEGTPWADSAERLIAEGLAWRDGGGDLIPGWPLYRLRLTEAGRRAAEARCDALRAT